MNDRSVLAMVSCQRCARLGLECRLSSLSKRCGHCVSNGGRCEPVEVDPGAEFAKFDREMARLDEQEEAAMAKILRLRKQKKYLKAREQKFFDLGLKNVEELEELERLEKEAAKSRSQEFPVSTPDQAALDPSLSNFQSELPADFWGDVVDRPT